MVYLQGYGTFYHNKQFKCDEIPTCEWTHLVFRQPHVFEYIFLLLHEDRSVLTHQSLLLHTYLTPCTAPFTLPSGHYSKCLQSSKVLIYTYLQDKN